jgi:type IV pilus assembly protein PilA
MLHACTTGQCATPNQNMRSEGAIPMTMVQRMFTGFHLPRLSLKKLHKNEKGLTLIELLAVIVILAIIAAIAVPSITGIIGKTKKESHRANAQMIIDGARYKITSEDFKPDGGTGNVENITLEKIVDDGFLEKVPKDPQGSGDYNKTATVVSVTMDTANKLTYKITLVGTSGTKYFEGIEEKDVKTADIGK